MGQVNIMNQACSIRLTITKINPPQREVNDCGVLLLYKVVFGEAFEVKDDVLR